MSKLPESPYVWLVNRGKVGQYPRADAEKLLERGFITWPHEYEPKEKYYPNLDPAYNGNEAVHAEIIKKELAVIQID